MKTIGGFFQEVRLRKKISLAKIERETKIKKGFVEAIENSRWSQLPDFTVVAGFVKSIANFLGIGEEKAVALLRRDYPPRKNPMINPKPDISTKFIWSPKVTFWAGTGLIALIILGYLLFQYKKFVSPPSLQVFQPKEAEIVKTTNLKVIGKTDSDAVVKVNNQPVFLDGTGNFETEIKIYEGTREIEVKATSRAGKETIVKRTIKPEL